LVKRASNFALLAVGALLAACLAGSYLIHDNSASGSAKRTEGASPSSPVDQRLLQTAQQLASAADTPEEQVLAREALGLADHEVDQAFATRLREAAAAGAPKSGPLKDLADRIGQLQARIKSDQARIANLTKASASNAAAADQLELSNAQLALDQDELEDAQQDLARQGGDEHARLQRALQEHEAEHHAAQTAKPAVSERTVTLAEQIQAWLSLRDRQQQLESAQQQAHDKAARMSRAHEALEKLINKQPASDAGAGSEAADSSENSDAAETAHILDRLRHLSDQRKSLTELDRRIQDVQQLAGVYNRWEAVVESRSLGLLRLLLRSLAAVLAIVMVAMLLGRAIRHAFGAQTDRKRLHQLRVMATLGVQLVAVVLIVLIVFGPPTQISTIIGLTTAGLTVALKDFIVAFFGWFALLGKNGIRVGDWVEINGVSGEVIEIGVLKTVLLEMGNWASTGHPTGRRVAFVNSFALEGHYFNFSTAGQWLWDELEVTLPATGDPYQTARQIRETVERETEADATEAEREWERVTRQYGTRPFSAKPAVDLQPSVNGLSVVVRYITHAPQRYQVKSRLFTAIVDVLHRRAESTTLS